MGVKRFRILSEADLATHVLLFLFVVAFVAGFVDAIAGGGGLIAIPALLMTGLPPLEVLGTSKLQALFGSGSATIAYARQGHVDLRKIFPMAVISFCGAVLGAMVATILPIDVLRAGLPVILIAIAIYFAVKPDIGVVERHPRLSLFVFGLTIVPLIGFYDGLFGPGTGSFFMFAFVSLAGFGILKATAHTKVLNFASNLGGFAVFFVGGAVIWKVGLLMALGQTIGAQLGSRLAMKNGSKIIRPMLVLSCIAMATKLILEADFPIRVWLGF
ncbi:inner membrane protein YfcA [Roseibium sp. TrichSKD4]|nr:inner membrane protein YfcA [Roseibium sp. TrichSKD4]